MPHRRWPPGTPKGRRGPSALGDSYISGEAGRWAGNTNGSSSKIDALGPTAYNDNSNGNGELIAGCHRSKSAEVYIGGGVSGENLACSGAKTSTFTDSEGHFKPGIDFYSSGSNEGQALMLQHFAAAHNVKLIAVSIGGNNFNFASIVQDCVDGLADLAVVVAASLQRRRLGDGKLHLGQRRHADRPRSRGRSKTSRRR